MYKLYTAIVLRTFQSFITQRVRFFNYSFISRRNITRGKKSLTRSWKKIAKLSLKGIVYVANRKYIDVIILFNKEEMYATCVYIYAHTNTWYTCMNGLYITISRCIQAIIEKILRRLNYTANHIYKFTSLCLRVTFLHFTWASNNYIRDITRMILRDYPSFYAQARRHWIFSKSNRQISLYTYLYTCIYTYAYMCV